MKKTVTPMKSSAGFTMVELIIVIAILGVLAATALPRFLNVTKEAKVAAVNGVAGGLRSAVGTVQAAYFAKGDMSKGDVTMADGTVVTVSLGKGIPTGDAAGIGKAITSTEGLSPDYTTATAVTFTPKDGGATCQATYNQTDGSVTTAINGC